MPTNEPRYEGFFKNGKIHDENAKLYYGDGNLQCKGSVINGKKDGMCSHYEADGSLKKSGVYREGKLIRDMSSAVTNHEKKLANARKPTQKNFSKIAKFPAINFNMGTAYMEKVIKGKINSYYRNFSKEGEIENFVSFHNKNEFVRVHDSISKELRFEGIVFLSRKQGICSFYNIYGKLIKREPYLDDKKVRSGLRFCANGKIKYRGDYSKNLQHENGFCIQYHQNGTISRIGTKTLGIFTEVTGQFYQDGAIKCLRQQTPSISVKSGEDRYSREGVLFWNDGSIRFQGEADFWGWDFEDSE